MTVFLTPNMRIGQAAQASGMSAASIRFYEQKGLLSATVRSTNGYRTYSAQDIDQLTRIRTCRSLDMSLEEIRQLLNAPTDSPAGCEITSQVLGQHLQHVVDRIVELQHLQKRLEQLLKLCNHMPDSACPTQAAMKEKVTATESETNSPIRHI